MKIIITVVISMLHTLAFAQSNSPTFMEENITIDEQAVSALVKQLSESMIKRDITTMTKILDKDFTLTHITGYVQPKAEWLNEVALESMKYYSVKEVNHKVKITGQVAEVTIQSLVDARIWGSRNTWRLQQKMRLEKRNEKWIILNSIASTF